MQDILDLKEKRQHGSFLFHFSVYENSEKFPDMPPHWHNELELLFGVKGRVELRIGEDSFILGNDEVLIIPCNSIHSSNSFNQSFYFHAIVFDPSLLTCSLVDTCRSSYIDPIKDHKIDYNLHIKGEKDWEKNMIYQTKTLINYYYKKPFGYELGIKGALSNIFFELISNNSIEKEENKEKKMDFERLKNTILYIQNNYMEKLTVDELAEKSYMSVYYFCRFFKKVTGMTPFDYLNNYRVQMAAKFLKETQNSITVIGYDVGFNDSSYFSKIFQKYLNCTPTEYRGT